MRHGSLFSGIGGFDLAAEWMGWENVFHCEWNPFGQRVLKHYWPNAKSYNDITKTDFTIHRGAIDILTGGFPCQPYSMAGKRKGKEDERHLWPQMLRAIREIKPKYIVGENVLGIVNWDGGLVFDEVHTDLELEGYEVAAVVIPAAAVNAPHGRDRVWFVANNNGIIRGERGKLKSREQSRYGKSNEKSNTTFNWIATDANNPRTNYDIGIDRNGEEENEKRRRQSQYEHRSNGIDGLAADPDSNGFDQRNGNDEEQSGEGRKYAQRDFGKGDDDGNATDTTSSGRREVRRERESRFNDKACAPNDWDNFPTQSPICGGDDGLSGELDGITFSKWRNESIKGYGNAIVPQVAYEIFKVIQIIETQS